jgi:signal transduction histidine kinase/ActR/RegA family two-component response regulator
VTTTRTVGLRRRLFLLAAAGILPLAFMSGIGLYALAQQQREQTERSSLELARALAIAVDAELRGTSQVLEALATTSALDTGDMAAFYRVAHPVVATRPQWRSIILSRPDGQVLVHTGYPLGRADLAIAEPENFDQILQSKAPLVGAMRRGPRGEFGVPVRVPVMRNGNLRFVLTGVVNPEAFLDVISRQRVPDDWVVSVFDCQGRACRALARQRQVPRARRAAPPAAPDGLGPTKGVGITYALEGDAILTAYSRIRAAAGRRHRHPAASVEAAPWRSSLAYGGGIAAVGAARRRGGAVIARSINRPIGSCGVPRKRWAAARRRDARSDIREIQEVSDALARRRAAPARRGRARAPARGRAQRARRRRAGAPQARAAGRRRRGAVALAAAACHAGSHRLQRRPRHRGLVPRGPGRCRRQAATRAHAPLDPQKSRVGAELVQRLRAAPTRRARWPGRWPPGRSHLAHFDPPREFDEIRDRDLLTFAQAIGMRAYFIVPLVARGRTLGAMAALQAESQRGFSEDDCALLAELAQRAALALDNARLYADAQAARSQAETANRTKDEFLAMLGHELRNPLAPIVTALHLMARRGGDEGALERRIIERQVAHLLRLVDDLLDVSRIARGKIQIQRERIDMRAVVERALELTQPALERRLRGIDIDMPPQPVWVTGDAVRLAQVLSNLLTNAAKFTPPDERIALALRADARVVEVAVEDRGSGISPELLPRIFNLFTQGEQGMDRHAGGLGLGLAIVKTLVRMHGGTVHAESEGPGQGSRFVVRLPAAEPAALAPHEVRSAPVPARRRGRVLLVDDNADAADMLGELLRDAGHDVCIAADGPAALAALDSFVPEVALLDIGLPGMDGYELAGRLRADPRTDGLRIVALTGYGREPDRARALATHFDEHLVKPVSAERLLEATARLLDDAADTATPR